MGRTVIILANDTYDFHCFCETVYSQSASSKGLKCTPFSEGEVLANANQAQIQCDKGLSVLCFFLSLMLMSLIVQNGTSQASFALPRSIAPAVRHVVTFCYSLRNYCLHIEEQA